MEEIHNDHFRLRGWGMEEVDGALGLRISPWPQGLNSRDEAEQWRDPDSTLRLALEKGAPV